MCGSAVGGVPDGRGSLTQRNGGLSQEVYYVRHGTTTLFAALDARVGQVIETCYAQHQAQEFRSFLEVIDAHVPPELEIHLILDNYVTHKTRVVQDWLMAHPRYHLHFTPTSASWLNLVEC